jgi:hypothetical protein
VLPTPIEVARSAILSFFFLPNRDPFPVHTHKIQRFFCDYYPQSLLEKTLDSLLLMKEVVKFPHGYWAPTPLRKIDLGNIALIISTQPTGVLARALGSDIQNAGYGRVCAHLGNLTQLPSENFQDWLGSPLDLKAWTLQVLEEARDNLLPSMSDGRTVQVYYPDKNGTSSSRRWRLLSKKSGFSKLYNLNLCRERTSFGQTRYFLAEIRDDAIHFEVSSNWDFLRLQYGLDALMGIDSFYSRIQEDGKVVVRIFRRLPESELRLFAALGRPYIKNSSDREFEFQLSHFGTVEHVLGKLGLKGKNRK